MISLEDFHKLDVKIGTVTSAEKVEESDKLIKLKIDFGYEKRQIITALAEYLDPKHFVGKQIPVLLNLPPRKFRGVESQGMIIAANVGGNPVLLHPENKVPNGSNVI